jgi:serine/threonine protein kinase
MAGMPTSIGRYRIDSELGRGGFGRVYKAFDPTVSRPVAIKLLTQVEPETLARFQNEATATANLHHLNIVTVYEYGEEAGSPYLVMEYLEGQDLQQILKGGQPPLTLLDKVQIMHQAAEGLLAAHRNGIIHRDVKPSNIRVLPDGTVKVMDFGIARLVQDSGQHLTQSGFLVGTMRYLAPEQVQGHDADTLSDIFAYGLIFYELISGKHPFDAPDAASILFKLSSQDAPPLSEAAPDCPEALRAIVMRTLAKERELRYQSFEDVLLDLQAVVVDLQRQSAAAFLARARTLLEKGQIVEAQALARKILELDPYNSEGRDLLQQVQNSLRQMAERDRVEAVQKAAQDAMAAGKFDQAMEVLGTTERLYPASQEIQILQAELRRAREEHIRARRLAEEERKKHEEEQAAALPDDATIRLKIEVPRAAPEKPLAPAEGFTQLIAKPDAAKPAFNASLTILSCPDSFREGQTIPLLSPRFTIGRSDTADLVISEDPSLSRQHASVIRSGSGYILQDLNTRNGTYVNGRRVDPAKPEPLFLNAEIRLSNFTRLRFRCDISELPDFTGQKLADRYTLERCMRAGRKSVFYEAADSRPVRKVAVKLLSPTLASYPGYLEQFQREAQTAAELAHPNICRIYEHGCAPLQFSPGDVKSVHYLCMQMLDGGSLAGRMDEPGHTTPATVAGWLPIVAGALDEAHRNGVVHAGLKPTSIVFSAAGVPYVTDFAIATRPSDAAGSQPVLGAPEYLAPEQWDGLPAGPEADQYSLACVVYRALTGVAPFENQLDPQARSRNFEQAPLAADVQGKRHARSAFPPAASAVLAKALSVKPADRFPSISEFARLFLQSLGEEPPPKRKPSVFVSYRREADAGWAALFADKLSNIHGIDVFVDRQRVDSARQVPEKIESAIRKCDVFVCLLARSTLESAWVREEIRIADTAGKPMIPVVQEGFQRAPRWPVPIWLRRFVPLSWIIPECAKRLLDAEEVRLFADYDDGAIDKLARMILAGRY